MGVSGECAVKGSKSHPCHCCASHVVASPSASVQQHQHQQIQQSHHHHQQQQLHHQHQQHHQIQQQQLQQQQQHHQQQQQQQQQQQSQHHNHHHHHHHHETHHAHHPNHHHHHHHHHEKNNVPTEVQHNGDNGKILAPLRSKMKVLKKLKRKMGLAPRSSSAGTNNLPPLTFHHVHGDNIRLCNGGTIARRHESFCKGVTFSARPVRVGEKVCVKFLEISDNWSGVIRFGFTSNDPINLRNGLPRYACPDLTNKPGYWAKALAERFADPDTVLFYYVTSAGDVHFGVNGEEKGLFFSGVETRGPLWAIIDVYGNSTAIEFVDPNRQHFNNIRRGAEHSNEDNAQHSRHSAMDDASNAGRDVERIIVPSLQSMSIHSEHEAELPGLRFQPANVIFTPLPFHHTRGRNIRFSNLQCVAMRTDTEFCHGYAFTGRPLLLGERLVVQILSTEPMYVGALALGLTSCDPARLTAEDLPDDSDLLLDRPEYWVVSKDVASSPQLGDEIAFTVTHYGEVQMSKNGGPPNVVMHVDQSLQLWAFVDVYGSTQRVRMLAGRPTSPPRQRQSLPSSATIIQQQQQQQQQHSNHSNAATELSRFSEMVQFKPAVGGGTVLVVNLPPQSGYPAPPPPTPQPIYASAAHRNPPPATTAHPPQSTAAPVPHPGSSRQSSPPLTGTMTSTGSSTYVDPVTYQSLDGTLTSQASSHLQQWSEGLQPTPGQPSECSICYERSIDSVLYMCGHMCMCYPCAIQQWRGKGGGQCPLCRAPIRDVIRIYRS